MSDQILLETRRLSKYFHPHRGLLSSKKGTVRALEDVNLTIYRQETLGVVGESGCGKTTLGRVLLNLVKPTSGQVIFEGQDLSSLERDALRRLRREMQIVFQNPYSSFDPRFSMFRSLTEPLTTHTNLRGAALEQRTRQLVRQVGMPEDALSRYPHEFSGGQLQRLAIARALALNPKFIVLDEPTSALDVSVQAQILNLLRELQHRLKLTYLFISHDLSVVQYISDRIAVMYLGKVVELIAAPSLVEGQAQHPYTRALLSAIPEVHPEDKRERIVMPSKAPDAARPPSGCSFHPRCPFAMEICAQVEPPLEQISAEHWSACHLIHQSLQN
ncbi:MAG: ABC transporter ATP-binding protein [Anaerolineales bacterium]|nr:ABC transporter ATP-binding protein [Anaerolineales bacterium]